MIVAVIGLLVSVLWLMTLVSNVGDSGSMSSANSLTFSAKNTPPSKDANNNAKPALPEFDLVNKNPENKAELAKANNLSPVSNNQEHLDAGIVNSKNDEANIVAEEKVETEANPINNPEETSTDVAPKAVETDKNIEANKDADTKAVVTAKPSSENKIDDKPKDEHKIASTFDVIRVDADGSVVVAGKFAPNSKINIMIDDNVWGVAETNADGEWVWISSDKLAPGDYELYTIGKLADSNVKSDRSQVISVPELVLSSTEAKKGALVVETDKKGGKSVVKQLPNGKLAQNASDKNPVISTIDYKDGVLTSISGSAVPAASLNVYIDNEFIGKVSSDEKKLWSLSLKRKIQDKAYKIRVDMVENDGGKVISRIESDFKPKFKKISGRKMIEVVQGGDSLWQIARKVYGDGYAYIDIYEANKSQIKDPKKLYPGQIFILPDIQKK